MDKLHKILKLRMRSEQDQASILSQMREARSEAQQQQQQLHELSNDYREQFSQLQSTNVYQLRQFQLFYAQLDRAVQAQHTVVQNMTLSEQQQHEVFVRKYQERRALELMLEQRDKDHKTKQTRIDRRAAIRSHSKPLV